MVSESAEEIYRRAQEAAGPDGRLAMPPVGEWETFPFEGEIRVRPLAPPAASEPPRHGEDPAECGRCARGDVVAIWSDERWRVVPLEKPWGLPVVVILESREHRDLGDLSGEPAAELGQLIVSRRARRQPSRGDRARARRPLGRRRRAPARVVHGPPGPAAAAQGRFAAIWDDILPPVPEAVWRKNLATVARALAED